MFRQLAQKVTTAATRITPASASLARGYHTDGNPASLSPLEQEKLQEQQRRAVEEKQRKDLAEYKLTSYVEPGRTSLTPEEQKSLEQSRKHRAALENEAAIETRAYSRKEQSKDARNANSTVSGSESITSNLFVVVRNTGPSK